MQPCPNPNLPQFGSWTPRPPWHGPTGAELVKQSHMLETGPLDSRRHGRGVNQLQGPWPWQQETQAEAVGGGPVGADEVQRL